MIVVNSRFEPLWSGPTVLPRCYMTRPLATTGTRVASITTPVIHRTLDSGLALDLWGSLAND